MKKFVKKYLSGVMVLFLSFCIAACGSTAGKKSVSTFKTQELFSKYSKDKGIKNLQVYFHLKHRNYFPSTVKIKGYTWESP